MISASTFYLSRLAKSSIKTSIKTRIGLTKIGAHFAVVAGFEFSNLGAQAGIIDDIVLLVKFDRIETIGIEAHHFMPLYTSENYNVNRKYKTEDFEQFQSITLEKDSRKTQYIVFLPNNDLFRPALGTLEVTFRFRLFDKKNWEESKQSVFIEVNETALSNWQNEDTSVMVSSAKSMQLRADLTKQVFQGVES